MGQINANLGHKRKEEMGGYQNETGKVRKSQCRRDLYAMSTSMDSGTQRELAKKGITPCVFYGFSGHSMEIGLEGQERKQRYLIGGHLHGPGEKLRGLDLRQWTWK